MMVRNFVLYILLLIVGFPLFSVWLWNKEDVLDDVHRAFDVSVCGARLWAPLVLATPLMDKTLACDKCRCTQRSPQELPYFPANGAALLKPAPANLLLLCQSALQRVMPSYCEELSCVQEPL